MTIQTPELDKMSKIQDKSQTIGAFLEWLGYRDPELILCEIDNDTEAYYPTYPNIEKLLAEYFEINLKKAEEERCAILHEIRNEKIPTINTDTPESIMSAAEKIINSAVSSLNLENTDLEIKPLVPVSAEKPISNIKEYKNMKRKLKKGIKNGN